MNIDDLTEDEKRESLCDWIGDMDEYGLDELLIMYRGFEPSAACNCGVENNPCLDYESCPNGNTSSE